MAEFQNGLFGCFGDIGLCIIAYFVPCYQAGKNAEAVGKDCCVYGGLYLFIPCISGALIRQRIRDEKSIGGSFVGDILTHMCCSPCALVQEGREMNPSPQVIARA